ncbi:MAG: GNAT family N-acetyltransferase [Ginsengibacter sp.]
MDKENLDIKIRRAEKEDCFAIMMLIKELAIYEKAPEEVTVDFGHFVESGFGPNPVWWAFVAEIENKVVAFAIYYIRYSTWKGQRMYLEDLLITEEMRGKGIGKLLFERLITEAEEKKLSGLVWQVLDWNEPAIHFYEKFELVKFDNDWINCSLEIK